MLLDQNTVAAFIGRCTEALQEQGNAAQGWPNPLILPLPENASEETGLDLFKAQLEEAGIRVTVKVRG